MALGTLLVSCGSLESEEAPSVTNIIAFDHNYNQIPFSNGDTNVDPSIAYIEVKFDKAMNTSCVWWTVYDWTHIYMGEYYFVNEYTYRIYFNLYYERNVKIVLNPSEYFGSDKDDYLFRSKNGKKLKEYTISFSTKPSINHPLTESFDVGDYIPEAMYIDLGYNEYGDPANMQGFVTVEGLIWPESLKAGDTISFKYKIRSDYDLPDIIVNLVDNSEQVDYWNVLAVETDLPLVSQPIMASTEDNPVYYENELTFHVKNNMTSKCTLQFTCKDMTRYNEGLPYQFIIIPNNN